MTHEELMARAVALSETGVRKGSGGPFGALIARDGEIISEGWNRVPSSNDPTAHAEVVAIRAAAQSLGTHVLKGCTLYTSCEPCPMCLAATYWARIDHVFYANTRADAASGGFDDQVFYDELSKPETHRALPMTRIVLPRAAEALREWERDPEKTPY